MTHDIPSKNLSLLKKQIEKLNRRAPRLGCPPITLTVLNEYAKEKKDYLTRLTYTQMRTEIEVVGESPKLEGWRLLAVIEPLENCENLVRCVPGCKVPEKYRNTSMTCDHCKTNRRRKEVFVLEHEDGRTVQVGRTCIADFLGHTEASTLAARAEYVMLADSIAEDAKSDCYCYRQGPILVDISQYVGMVAICIRRFGWLSRSKAGNDMPTADLAWTLLTCVDDKIKKYIGDNDLFAEERDTELAKSALIWARGLSGGSDYSYNLGVTCRQGYVSSRTSGLVASVIVAYQNHLDKQARVETEKKIRGYVGQVGERKDFEVMVKRLRYFDSHWGVTTFALFEDSDGNHIMWKASKSLDLEEGDSVTLRATVKEHGDYKGIPQTVVSRGTIKV